MSTLHIPRYFRWTFALAFGLIVLGLAPSEAAAQNEKANPERFTAFAINLGTRANLPTGQTGIVEITIDRWSTPQERQTLLDALGTKGNDGLLESLRDTPRVGYIRTPDSVAWDLHYSHQEPTADGGRRIFLATDRKINFWEALRNTRSLDYPFTLVELHLDKNGEGEGKLSIATRITPSKEGNFIQLENYTSEPVRLQQVKAKR